jgi:hypothetical protein
MWLLQRVRKGCASKTEPSVRDHGCTDVD